jgi:2-dehydro-3-deoxyphosphogluconate aldolase / (4S)-4-hydroxy-2-oxoglutarate aldolase
MTCGVGATTFSGLPGVRWWLAMPIEETLERIKACGVVAVVRGIHSETLARTIQAVLEGGVDCVEISMSVRGALRDITVEKSHWGDRAVIGAGEVLNGEMATLAAVAQADFCSGVGAQPEMIRTCSERDILALPGALTPTEIQVAWHAGAPVVKVFPACILGPAYLETVGNALSRVELLPSGGITVETAPEFIRAGGVAVGSGRCIVDADAANAGDFGTITSNAAAMVAAVRSARG